MGFMEDVTTVSMIFALCNRCTDTFDRMSTEDKIEICACSEIKASNGKIVAFNVIVSTRIIRACSEIKASNGKIVAFSVIVSTRIIRKIRRESNFSANTRILLRSLRYNILLFIAKLSILLYLLYAVILLSMR